VSHTNHTKTKLFVIFFLHIFFFALGGFLIWYIIPTNIPACLLKPIEFVLTSLFVLIKIVCILISVAYFTIAERKIMASIQRRKGPDVVGIFGLLQPLADGLKLLVKQLLLPTKANLFIFLFAPVLLLTLSLIS